MKCIRHFLVANHLLGITRCNLYKAIQRLALWDVWLILFIVRTEIIFKKNCQMTFDQNKVQF